MLIDEMEGCCEVAVFALDGVYGWGSEALAIIIFVFIFNFAAKWLLSYLDIRFKKQGRIWKRSFVSALYKPLSYYVWFFAAVQTLDIIASHILEGISVKDRHMVLSIGALIAFTWFLMRWKKFVAFHMIEGSKRREITIDQGKISAIDKMLTIVILFFMALLLLEVSGRSMNTIIAFGGVGGLALAFASQEIISNFFGGFMIYLTQPFTIGDWISIPDHKIEGIVEEIGWYMTRVRSLDKRPIYIPNAIFSKLIVITPSRMSHRQIKETIKISYEDISKIKPLLHDFKEMLEQHLDMDRSQPIVARLFSFGDSTIEVLISANTQTIDNEGYLRIKEDVLFKISAIMEKHGVNFSYLTQQPITIINK